VSFQGSVEGEVETRVGEEEGKEDIVIFVEFLEARGKGVRRGRHDGLFLRRASG